MYNDSISSYNNTSHSHSYDSYSGDVYDRSDVTVPKFEPPTPAKSPPQVASTDSGGGEAANV
jgi:hypothetical protein